MAANRLKNQLGVYHCQEKIVRRDNEGLLLIMGLSIVKKGKSLVMIIEEK
jgi:hypothetical protein